ncbi:hypothetical protein PVK06_049353 [Gossypium arboreum]|uniref:DNA-directed RNA polymerase n=1 Tax=Gossypium arboreum TaxID=29729 RepID=A0ABR0MII2_GOSAR|nr:hypothetical protein PVK06_049353 [Gossypium arboreum]
METGDILVGKLTSQVAKESSYAPEDRLLRAILGIQVSTSKETCLKLPIGGRGRVIDVRWVQKKGGSSYNPETIHVYISQKREIKVGDKVAGRHGNKGIISKILPRQDMPYLQGQKPVNMVFNPLGKTSKSTLSLKPIEARFIKSDRLVVSKVQQQLRSSEITAIWGFG